MKKSKGAWKRVQTRWIGTPETIDSEIGNAEKKKKGRDKQGRTTMSGLFARQWRKVQ